MMIRGLSRLLTIAGIRNDTLCVSEWVSPGHPDKTCDYISSYLLDRNLEKDPKTRFAVEAMLKDQQCTLGGEVTGKANFNDDQIRWFARNAFSEIGYTREYQDRWGRKNAICGEDVDVFPTISRQSPDIAKGVDRDAWGDQGIFFGMAVDDASTGFMPKDHYLARELGMKLYLAAREDGIGGLDIKTMVSCRGEKVESVVVAIPMQGDGNLPKVREIAVSVTGCANVTINGTGSYVTHSSIGDCGVTGRKLAVDFYGGNCPIGGGSPWTKDPTKADLTLNIHARQLALDFMRKSGRSFVQAALSCVIGRKEVDVSYRDEHGREIESARIDCPPSELIRKYRLDRPIYTKLCMEGIFSVCS